MRRVLGVAFALVVMACVDNGDTGDAAAQGTLGGSCFPNNTCNGSLVCTLVNGKGVCQAGDASVQDAPSDTTTNDAPSDVTSDAPADVKADADAGCNPTIARPCGGLNCYGQGKGCCEKLDMCGQTSADCNSTPLFQCTGQFECNSTFPCCITASFDTSQCPMTTQQTGLQVACATTATCASGSFQLCVTSTECTQGKTCTPFTIDQNVFGLCM